MEQKVHDGTHSSSGSSDIEDDDDGAEYDGADYDGAEYDGDSIGIIQFNSGDEFEADLVILFNDEQISISVLAPRQSLGSCPEKHVLDLIRQASPDNYNRLSNEILDIVQPAGEDEFRRVAPKPPALSSHRSNTKLHSLLYPKTHYFFFRREAPDAQPKIVPMTASEVQTRAWAPMPCHDGFNEGSVDDSCKEIRSLLSRHRNHLPQYTTNDVIVIEEILSSGAVTRVRAGPHTSRDDVGSHDNDDSLTAASGDLLCKATDNASGLMASPTLRRELACLLTLHEHGYQVSSSSAPTEPMLVRTPRLVGLITHPDNGRIIGFVREWVPGKRLADVLKRGKRGKNGKTKRGTPPSTHDKQRWAQQLRASVDALHALGLVWGDGKTSNLIVGVGGADHTADDVTGAGHREGEAPLGDLWLIDFGGGWTDGWVDSDKENTILGDEQAVQNILDVLRI